MLARHAIAWIDAAASWQTLTPGAEARLRAWFADGHPAIVARRDGSEPHGMLRLGVPLPPAEHKQRLGLLLPLAQLRRHTPPPTLDVVIVHAPAAWRDALQELAHASSALGFAPRVFGSFAWQALTGLAYVHDASDLDLLWPVTTPAHADAIVALLKRWELRHGRRADGEFLLPDDGAVNWREYAGDARQMLIKADDGCRMVAREALFTMRSVA